MAGAAAGAIPFHQGDRGFDQPFSQFLRIADGGGGQDELRPGPVIFCHTFQPPEDICNVRAKNPAIRVHLVDDNEFEITKEIRPIGMVRQYPRMEHIRVGENDMGIFTDG